MRQIDEATMVSEYLKTKIGIKAIAKKYRIGQTRAIDILKRNGVNTSLGKKRNARGSSATTYRGTVERSLKRNLQADEWVHHIDGDRTNNDLSNLAPMPSKTHRELHRQIEQVTFDLFKAGLLRFNRTNNQYVMTSRLLKAMKE